MCAGMVLEYRIKGTWPLNHQSLFLVSVSSRKDRYTPLYRRTMSSLGTGIVMDIEISNAPVYKNTSERR